MKNLDDLKIHVKFKLSALWASVMFCYLYGDYFGLYQPGNLQSMLAGKMGPLGAVTQTVLFGTSVMMVIPSLMVFLSLALTASVSRWLNIIFGILYSVIIALTMPGAWVFYIFLGVIEFALTALAAWYAWNWPKQVAPAD